MRTRYFGHACILVETPGREHPLRPGALLRVPREIPRYTYSDLPDRIDYVVITHNHQDHVLLETLLQLRHKIGTVVVPRGGGGGLQDPSLRLVLQRIGFSNVIEIDEMETIEIEGGTLTGVPFMGEHTDLDIRTKMTYLVQLGAGSPLLAADSCNIEPRIYEHVQRCPGDVDVLFLGMECDGAPLSWLYGPLITRPLDRKIDHSRRLSGSNYRARHRHREPFRLPGGLRLRHGHGALAALHHGQGVHAGFRPDHRLQPSDPGLPEARDHRRAAVRRKGDRGVLSWQLTSPAGRPH